MEASKNFVLGREQVFEETKQDLMHEVEMKDKQIEKLKHEIAAVEEQCHEHEFAVEREKQAYQDLLKECEENEKKFASKQQSNRNESRNQHKIGELEEKLSKASRENAKLKTDLSTMAQQFEKEKKDEKSEKDGLCRLQRELKEVQANYEERELEMKQQASYLEKARKQAQQTDEKYMELEVKYDGVMIKMKEYDNTKKQLSDALKKVRMVEQESNRLKAETTKLSSNKRHSLVSPIVSSMSSLSVDTSLLQESVFPPTGETPSSKSAETPKRLSDTGKANAGMFHEFVLKIQ